MARSPSPYATDLKRYLYPSPAVIRRIETVIEATLHIRKVASTAPRYAVNSESTRGASAMFARYVSRKRMKKVGRTFRFASEL